MPVLQWLENSNSRSASIARKGKRADSSVDVEYQAFGATTDAEIHAYANNYFSANRFYQVGDYVLMIESYSVRYDGDQAWTVTAHYVKAGADDETQTEPLRRLRSFDTSGGTAHITQAIKGAGTNNGERRWGSGGENGAPYAEHAIGVDGNSVNGVDIVIPQLTWTETYDVPSQYVTSAYIKNVASLTGTVNSAAFRTFAAGEVLFVGASGSQEWDAEKGNGPWTLAFKFIASPNAGAGQTVPALEVGSITGIEKRGHDYLWVRYEDSVTDDTLIKKPKHVYVNKVYRDGNFSLLGIGVA